MKKRFLSLALFLACVFAPASRLDARQESARPVQAQSAASEPGSAYVGLRHGAQLPEGLKEGGYSGQLDTLGGVEFSLQEVLKGNVRMVWFERVVGRDAEGVPQMEVLDVLTLPTLAKNQRVAYSSCTSGKKVEQDAEIVAVFDYVRGVNYFTRLRSAWRANRRSRKFEEIPVTGIKCLNTLDEG